MNLRKPIKEDLKKGLVTKIFLDGEIYEGIARLIEKRPSWRDVHPYIKAFINENEDNERVINWSQERWLVEFLEGRLKGQKVLRWIHYYHSTGIIENEIENLQDNPQND